MLADYIKAYIDAVVKDDVKEMKRIENDMRKLGMDKATLVRMSKWYKEEENHA